MNRLGQIFNEMDMEISQKYAKCIETRFRNSWQQYEDDDNVRCFDNSKNKIMSLLQVGPF